MAVYYQAILLLCVICTLIKQHVYKVSFMCLFQFDEEFSARQEAQTESQKKDERIKELETQVLQLEATVLQKIFYFISVVIKRLSVKRDWILIYSVSF